MNGITATTHAAQAVGFFDGMNLFRHAKDAFGYDHPNYDPQKLMDAVCQLRGWKNNGVRFYTGIPDAIKDPSRHKYWANRLLAMRRMGILATSRPVRYRTTIIDLPDGSQQTTSVGQEKGIDIRIALDIIRLVSNKQCEAVVIFSQDQDLSEVVKEAKDLAKLNNCTLQIASAFPSGNAATSKRGVDGTDWVKIDRTLYDQCLDLRDYR